MRNSVLAVAASLAISSAQAVEVNADGLGQALIFPYYTVRTADAGLFNTYLSIINNSFTEAKAIRVRFREGRNAKAVANINVFLPPRDIWAVALVPTGSGVLLITRDGSCTDPELATAPGSMTLPAGARGLVFSDAAYAGAGSDGAGADPARMQEGFVEALEMATVRNIAPLNALNAIVQDSAGVGVDCSKVRGLTAASAEAGTFAAPTGDLSGSATLINVANGVDFTYAAEALAQLASSPYYTAPGAAGADFASAPIDPVSTVLAGGRAYRSTWPRGLDAVNAALMRVHASAEFTTEDENGARTDLVVAFPTRHFDVTVTSARAPFQRGTWSAGCAGVVGQETSYLFMDRAQRQQRIGEGCGGCGPVPHYIYCGAVNVSAVRGGSVAGSQQSSVAQPDLAATFIVPPVRSGVVRLTARGGSQELGWIRSLPDSTRVDLATGAVEQGSHVHFGLPMSGFALRSLRNGFLACGTGTCLGNYGAVFPFRYERSITTAP